MGEDDYIESYLSHFKESVPKIFIEQIQKTWTSRKVHIPQLQGMFLFYRLLRIKLPRTYLTKSRIRIGNGDLDSICPQTFEYGTIENATLLLEKQFFDIVVLLLVGSYRPIHVILRYMLELTARIAISIINKEKITGNHADHNKAMSFLEFEAFLETNNSNIKKNKDPETKKQLKIRSGIPNIDDQYVQFIHYKKFKGLYAIKSLYGDLSKYAHSNVWNKLRTDDGSEMINMEKNGICASIPNGKQYHEILDKIIKTHEVIYYLLFAACYENLIYYNKDDAADFSTAIHNLTKKLKKYSLKFPDLEKITKELFPKQEDGIDQKEYTRIIPDTTDEYCTEQWLCSECESTIFFKEEICTRCYHENIGNSTPDDYFI